MEDVCYYHFVAQSCPAGAHCPLAHNLCDLKNMAQWVLFPAGDFRMTSSLKAVTDRVYFLPAEGPLLRCTTVAGMVEVAALPGAVGLTHFLGMDEATSDDEVSSEAMSDDCELSAAGLEGLNIADMCGDWALDLQGVLAGLAWQEAGDGAPLMPRTAAPSPADTLTAHLGSWAPFGRAQASLQPTQPEIIGNPCRTTPAVKPSAPQQQKAAADAKSRKQRSGQRVLELLSTSEMPVSPSTGWEVVRKVWHLRPSQLDGATLRRLQSLPAAEQEQILLTFAAMGLINASDASPFLDSLIADHQATPQVCVRFLAGVCQDAQCRHVHPHNTRAWQALEKKWGYTHRDLDFAVLNYLAKKAPAQQEVVVQTFAAMNLKNVKNLSAYFSAVIRKVEQKEANAKSLAVLRSAPCDLRNNTGASSRCPKAPRAATPAFENWRM